MAEGDIRSTNASGSSGSSAGDVVPQDRFCLVLLDPLLDDHKFWPLTKSPVTVSLTEDPTADFVVPWREMGFGHVADILKSFWKEEHRCGFSRCHRRPDPDSSSSPVGSVQHPQVKKLKEEKKECPWKPAFELIFHDERWTVSSCWHALKFSTLIKFYDRTFSMTVTDAGFRVTIATNLSRDHEGYFPSDEEYGDGDPNPRKVYGLRFFIMDRKKAEEENARKAVEEPNPMPIGVGPILQDCILQNIAGYLKRDTLLGPFLMASPDLMGTIKGYLPMSDMRLNTSMDSLRLCKLVSSSEINSVVCGGLPRSLPASTRKMFVDHWRPFLSAMNLETLIVADVSVLLGVNLSEKLVEFGILAEYHMAEMDGLDTIKFPPSIHTLSFDFSELHKRRQYFPADVPIDEAAFPNVTSLAVEPCPPREFWNKLKGRFLCQIERLNITFNPRGIFHYQEDSSVDEDGSENEMDGSNERPSRGYPAKHRFPIRLFKNLKELRYCDDFDDHGRVLRHLRGSTCESLETLILPSCSVNGDWKTVSKFAPNLKHFECFSRAPLSDQAVDFLKKMDYFYFECVGPVSVDTVLQMMANAEYFTLTFTKLVSGSLSGIECFRKIWCEAQKRGASVEADKDIKKIRFWSRSDLTRQHFVSHFFGSC